MFNIQDHEDHITLLTEWLMPEPQICCFRRRWGERKIQPMQPVSEARLCGNLFIHVLIYLLLKTYTASNVCNHARREQIASVQMWKNMSGGFWCNIFLLTFICSRSILESCRVRCCLSLNRKYFFVFCVCVNVKRQEICSPHVSPQILCKKASITFKEIMWKVTVKCVQKEKAMILCWTFL